MRGVKFEDLLAIVDFFYCGETNVLQENLDSFLALADELQLRGLRKDQSGDKMILKMTASTHVKNEMKPMPSHQKLPKKPNHQTAIMPMDESSNVDLEELDR